MEPWSSKWIKYISAPRLPQLNYALIHSEPTPRAFFPINITFTAHPSASRHTCVHQS